MKKAFLLALGSCLTSANLALSQYYPAPYPPAYQPAWYPPGYTPPPPPPPSVQYYQPVVYQQPQPLPAGAAQVPAAAPAPTEVPTEAAAPAPPHHDEPSIHPAPPARGCAPRYWVQGDYLHWWLRDAPLPPLVTFVSNPLGVALPEVAGSLGSNGSQVVSPDKFDYGAFSGARLNVGKWLDANTHLGVEATGFYLFEQTASFSIGSQAGQAGAFFIPFSDAGTTFAIGPPNALTFFNFTGEDALLLSGGVLSGQVTISSSTQLWGTDVNMLFKVRDCPGLSLTVLVGGRYLDLQEQLDITYSNSSVLPPAAGQFLNASDSFHTQNQFMGGQIGLRGEGRYGILNATLTGKFAVGNMRETVDISGATALGSTFRAFNGLPGTATNSVGGVFTQVSNVGQYTRDRFAIVPEVNAQVGVDVCANFRVFAGYDFLYADEVVRPGDQVDRRINFNQRVGTPVGAAAPNGLTTSTNFWAHGANFGMLFKF